MYLPCDLLIVIAKAGFTGNCLLTHSMPPGLGTNIILGIRTVLYDPDTLHRRTFLSRFPSYISFVPLQSPCRGFKFLRSINGIIGFKSSECGGNPLGLREFRYSTLKRIWSAELVIWSALLITSEDPGSLELSISFSICTSLFVGAKIARPSIQFGSFKL